MATETIENVAHDDTPNREIHEQLGRKYSAGFITEIESDSLPPGLDEDTIRALSAKKVVHRKQTDVLFELFL